MISARSVPPPVASSSLHQSTVFPGAAMFRCAACGGKHATADEGRVCHARKVRTPRNAPRKKEGKSTSGSRAKPAKKPAPKKTKKGPWFVRPEERPFPVPKRRTGPFEWKAAENLAAEPAASAPSGPSKQPTNPPKPRQGRASNTGRSKLRGVVWQPPSDEAKTATPEFDRDNRPDYI